MPSLIRCTITVLVAFGLWAAAPPCRAGDVEGLLAYERGDYATAVQEWWPLAEQGHALAQFSLGGMYVKGRGVPQDYAQAMHWYRRAAEQGHATAQFNLGAMYAEGRGVPQDSTQAILWYRRAAGQGDADAQFNLGLIYYNGQGAPQDYTQAIHWYRRAAEQGHAKAQNNLGLMYDNGQGVSQDPVKAYFWYNLSAAHLPSGTFALFYLGGGATAVQNRDRVAARLTPTQLADAQARTRTWQPTRETPGARPPADRLLLPVSASPAVSVPSPRRELIRQVQERLQAAGFKPGPIDGALGSQTQQALRWFQGSKGLTPTGDLDEKTLDVLGVR